MTILFLYFSVSSFAFFLNYFIISLIWARLWFLKSLDEFSPDSIPHPSKYPFWEIELAPCVLCGPYSKPDEDNFHLACSFYRWRSHVNCLNIPEAMLHVSKTSGQPFYCSIYLPITRGFTDLCRKVNLIGKKVDGLNKNAFDRKPNWKNRIKI